MTTVAILGHAEHGKTSVAQALTGAGGGFTILDGHFDATATAAVVVVSAPDGPMPGTRDAVAQVAPSGKKLVYFLNKVDIIGKGDDELLDLVEMEMRELVNKFGGDGDGTTIIRGSAKYFLDNVPIEHGSKRTHGIRELLTALY